MTDDQIEIKLKQRFEDRIKSSQVGNNGLEIRVEAADLFEVLEFCRDEADLDFHYLRCISGVDWPDDNELEVVYHLLSYRSSVQARELTVKVRTERDAPKVPSVVFLWKTADWSERETYDLFGIVFEGHPDLRRIYLPDFWEGHPLRKDFEYDVENFDLNYAQRILMGEIE